MTLDIFDPLFEFQDNRLNDLGNPLVELAQTVDWEGFRTLLMRIYQKERKSAPDAKTFWVFRNCLTELKLMETLFDQFSCQLNQTGFIARKGQIVDASIMPAPVQRNRREENFRIKQGDVPDDWNENKRCQKDTDARWTKKNWRSYYGYKNHIQVDNDNKLIRKYQTTDASVHDSNVFEELLDSTNTNKSVWADSAYRSGEKEANLKEKGYRSHV